MIIEYCTFVLADSARWCKQISGRDDSSCVSVHSAATLRARYFFAMKEDSLKKKRFPNAAWPSGDHLLSKLLNKEWLAHSSSIFQVLLYPLVQELRLPYLPVVWPQMDGCKVYALWSMIGREVLTSNGSPSGSRVDRLSLTARPIEALFSHSNHMIRIQRLQMCWHLLYPFLQTCMGSSTTEEYTRVESAELLMNRSDGCAQSC